MKGPETPDGNNTGKKTPHSATAAQNLEHKSVLLKEAVELLAPHPGGIYVDGTVGAGGHAAEILALSAPDGILIGLDQDADAVERSRAALARFGSRAMMRHANYRDLPDVVAGCGFEQADGVLLDLGVSWFHLKSPDRGFSFMLEGPLDMRMDRTRAVSAADLVNKLPIRELAKIIREYGEESRAGAIARAIEKVRARESITTTAQLARIISSVFPPYPPRRIHPATLTFQALRIAVNDEIEVLREGLHNIIPILKKGGRIAVISFHSLEDRVVKQVFAEGAKECICPPRMPVCRCGKKQTLKVLTKRPIVAGAGETASNPAARSAKLRAAEKM